LCKVFLAPLHKIIYPFTTKRGVTEAECIKNFISQFSHYNCLQQLFVKPTHFLRNKINQVLGSLMTPLKILSITRYQISQSDLDFFPCCQSLFQLKHLDLRGVVLQDFDLMPLRGLLEKVADTLKTLDLLGCRIEDFQVNVLLPALRQCSRLRYVNFYNNDFSMAILKDLFQHTVNWSKMKVEKYPAPLECYDDLTHLFKERFPHLCQDLVDTLRAVRQPKNISFATLICHTCDERCVYDQVSRLCGCWE
ncbi:oogenesin-1-like, partial [Grammomys surdaster]|uniref:oogenesin-1-like n=1 Tax=Grammomys surdaster TaxID=491861 RepID=UPI00109EEDB9